MGYSDHVGSKFLSKESENVTLKSNTTLTQTNKTAIKLLQIITT